MEIDIVTIPISNKAPISSDIARFILCSITGLKDEYVFSLELM